MAGLKGIQRSLCGILTLLFTAVTGLEEPSFTVRVGSKVTLPCGKVMNDQLSCGRTAWLSSLYSNSEPVELVTDGKISKNEKAKAKSHRLSITADCSLVITNVSREDVGRYLCREYITEREYKDSYMLLSAVDFEGLDDVRFSCTVLIYGGCWHEVQWLYEGNIDDIEIAPGTCTSVVTLQPDRKFKELLKCNVKDRRSGQSVQIKVSSQSSAKEKGWWPYAVAAAGIAALLITVTMVMMFFRRKKTKAMKTPRNGEAGQSLKPAESWCGTEMNQGRVDPGDEVSYASVSYNKKISSKDQADDADGDGYGDDGNEGDAVTYSSVKVSSPAAEASIDPSSLYASINRAGKGGTPG